MANRRNLASEYLNEEISFGGYLMPRCEVIRLMRAEGHPERCIDIWLMGNASATERRKARERVAASA